MINDQPHLLAVTTPNGRRRLPGLYDYYGYQITVNESTNASEPLLRLEIKQTDGTSVSSAATLDVKTALHLIDQLHDMIDNHHLIRASRNEEDQSR